MKTKINSTGSRSIFWIIVTLCILSSAYLQAQTTTRRAISVAPGDNLKILYYELEFPGGRPEQFFDFWRTNGFAKDTVLFAGEVDRVYIPSFKIKDAQLSEVAKSIEFVTQEALKVEVIEPTDRDRGNIWRVKRADGLAATNLKTKACALPSLLGGGNGEQRVRQIVEEVHDLLHHAARSSGAPRPDGDLKIIKSEKIVVAVGSETYVEAIFSALQAAEQAAAGPPKKQSE